MHQWNISHTAGGNNMVCGLIESVLGQYISVNVP